MAKINIDSMLHRADAHLRKGDVASARALYTAVLDVFPKNPRAQRRLASLDAGVQKTGQQKAPPQHRIEGLIAVYNQTRFAEMVELAEDLAAEYASSPVVWNILAAGKQALGQLAEAVSAYGRAIMLKPDYSEAHYNLGNVLQELGELSEAIAAYSRALEIRPAYAAALNNMANALKAQGQYDQSIAAYRRALQIEPEYAEAVNNMGNALKAQGKLDDAISAYRRALELKPTYAIALNNLANSLTDQKKYDEAIATYKRAIDVNPSYAAAYNNMGNALKDQGRLDAAIAAYRHAVSINPMLVDGWYNLSFLLQEVGETPDAISGYKRVLEMKPNYASAEAQLIYQKFYICDWSDYGHAREASARLGIHTDSVPPFALLSANDSPGQQLERAKKYAQEKYNLRYKSLLSKSASPSGRIKIGYFSADIHNHATMYLIAGLFRGHDKENFEIFCYSYGMSKSGNFRQEAEDNVEHFFDVTSQSDIQIVELARGHELDIAIDLKGYTQHTRSGIFQYRIAPIQINYLGYPGSMGADFIDYIVADHVVISDDLRQFYSESVIYLPHSYQPNDNARFVDPSETTRENFALPNDAFVFCCFNNNYKVGPKEFDIWMRLLHKIDKSVLWLLRANKWAEDNLRREAKCRGIDPARIIFAENLPHSKHLERHRHADLFLDTFNVNAHTTASDALWAGLPVITKIGEQFSARVAASLLNAVHLPELITKNEEEYERLILDLANSPERLFHLKRHLSVNRMRLPLFDTERYVRNFESGLLNIYELLLKGECPRDVMVTENDDMKWV
jgi:protein O-GlcNAc transferase